jgi:hypothetical protein
VNRLGDKDIIRKNTLTLIDDSKEVGTEINVEKSTYILQNHDTQIANRSFKNVTQFKYLRIRVTNQNMMQEEIKRKMNSGNACYHSVQKLS